MKLKRAFSIVEIVVTMALVVLFTAAGHTPATAAPTAQDRSASSLQADNAAAELCAAYDRAYQQGAEGAALYNQIADNIAFCFGFTISAEYTEGAEHIFSQGEHLLQASFSQSSYTFLYESGSLKASAVTEGGLLTVTVTFGTAERTQQREVGA